MGEIKKRNSIVRYLAESTSKLLNFVGLGQLRGRYRISKRM